MIRHTHERRSRPAAALPFTDADLKAWRKFLAVADATQAKPSDDVLRFARAAEKMGKAPLPIGHERPDSPFVMLIRLGKSWSAKTGVERIRCARDVAGLARGCAAVLDALSPPQPRLPYSEG